MPVTSLGTYDTLTAAIADWLNRADLASRIPDFVTMAEAQFNRELRVRDMQVRSEALSNQEFVPLPADYLQNYSLALRPGASFQPDLKFISKKQADTYKSRAIPGPVMFYTMTDGAFELVPAPTTNVDLVMVYYARLPALGEVLPTGTRQTNWLLTKSPDLYLASSILNAAPYLNDQQRLQTWSQLRTDIMSSMVLENERALRPETQLIARVEPF